MPECILCRRNVLIVDQKNLCGECRAAVTLEVAARLDTIYFHHRIVQTSDDLDECLQSCDLIIKEAEALLPYEKLEIEVAPPLPSEIINITRELKDDIIVEKAEHLLESLETNGLLTSDDPETISRTKEDTLSNLQQLKSQMADPLRLNEIEQKLLKNLGKTNDD